jgi:hypothetical protein
MQYSIKKIGKPKGIRSAWDKAKFSRIRKESKKAIRSKRLIANWIKENF